MAVMLLSSSDDVGEDRLRVAPAIGEIPRMVPLPALLGDRWIGPRMYCPIELFVDAADIPITNGMPDVVRRSNVRGARLDHR
jgi:hypothetical protein